MAAIYSTLFLSGNTSAGSPIFTVPAGFIAVLRDVDVYCNGIGGEELFLEDSTYGNTFARWDILTPADSGSKQWQGRQVFNPGGGFVFVATVGTWDVRASGYLLTAP